MATQREEEPGFVAGDLWGAIQPSVFASMRAILDFGLARATRDFNEWAFPGIGGVAFARQFAWSVMALRIAPQCKSRSQRPMLIAEALEALAAFIAIHRNGNYSESTRIRGKRKLADNHDNFSYMWLRSRANYVSQPMRMGTTSGLVGCGLATGSVARFDRLQLTDEGVRLADTLLNRPLGGNSPKHTVKSWLLEKWIDADGGAARMIPARIRDVLLPGPRGSGEIIPSAQEVAQLAVLILRDPTRQIMCNALAAFKAAVNSDRFNAEMNTVTGQNRLLGAIADIGHRKRVAAGIAYGQMTASALETLTVLATAVSESRRNNRQLPISQLPQSVINALGSLSAESDKLQQRLADARLVQADATQFCREQSADAPAALRIKALIGRAKDVFSIVGGNIVFGRLYREDLFASGTEASDAGRELLVLADSDAPGESLQRSPVPGRVFRAFSLLEDLSMLGGVAK